MISKDYGGSPFPIDPGSAHRSKVLTDFTSSEFEVEFPEWRSAGQGIGFDISEERHRSSGGRGQALRQAQGLRGLGCFTLKLVRGRGLGMRLRFFQD